MDDQFDYDEHEDEKFLIGNLLADDDTYSPTKDVRNIPRSNLPQQQQQSSPSFSFTQSTNLPWPDYVCSPPPTLEWNPSQNHGIDWTKFSTNSLQNYTNTLPAESSNLNAESFRHAPLSLSFGQNYIQPNIHQKPTATVPPFQTLNDLNKSDDTSSPVSDERASDSGTISPDVRPKQIKWKKVDLSAIESKQKVEGYSRQHSESIHQNGKSSYSSVAQVNGHHHFPQHHHQQQQHHKRLSATSSVPISSAKQSNNQKSNCNNNIIKKSTTTTHSGRPSTTQPVTPEDPPPKPSKIVGLNPINNTNSTYVSEPQKVHIAAATTTPTVAPDFQKIKRKKKGKASSKKTDAKNEQRSGSRYLALVQSSDYTNGEDFLIENGPSDDEEDEFDENEYQLREEEEKEQIREQARRQFENDKVSEEEANEKMKKLENEIRVIFEKRKTAKQQKISSQRHRRRKNGYQIWIPAFFSVISSIIVSAIYQAFTFFINLVTNVLFLSYHALTDSFKTLIYNFYQFIRSFFVLTIGTVFNSSRNFIEQIKQCGEINCQIGLSSNSAYPIYCEDVLERLYDCQNADAFSVLGLTKSATIEEINIHFKKNVAVINPSKKYNVGCEDARILLQTAYELISTDARKSEYLNELEQLPQTYALQVQLDEYKYLINSKGAILHCECGENHSIIRVSNYDGRYCAKCNQSHPVKNGDLWVDKQYFGWVLTYYAVINNTIYDVTDWGNCAANCLKRPKPNPHMITHRLYNASLNAAVTNVTEKHRCSCRGDSTSDRCTTRSIVLPKDPLPWKYSCCCSLLVCSPSDPLSIHDIPCCFGGIFIAINTTAAPITISEKLTGNEQARKAGRRRRYR
jgi:hypothetical protein